jgi:hypothetical protein
VTYAILQGTVPFDSRTEEDKLKVAWLPAKNGEVLQPDLAKIPDGIHHLLVRARDNRNLWSQPADLPFLCDRVPPKVTTSVTPAEKYNGSSLNLVLEARVAPPVINNIRLTCLGTPLALASDNGFCAIGQGSVTYEIDWIWLLRRQLATAKHGDVLPISVDGIADAAGNTLAPLKIDIPLDLESDKRPPTILPVTKTDNVLWSEPALTALLPFFSETRNLEGSTVNTPEGRVVEITPSGEGGSHIQHPFAPVWDPDKYPFLAVSFRTLAPLNGHRPFTIAFHTGPRRPRGIKDAHTLDLTLTNHLAFVTGSVECKTGEWNDVIINVRDFLRYETEERKDTPDLTYVSFYFSPKLKGAKIQFRSLAILAPWTSDHLIPLKAYDLSSIKGLVWPGGESELTGIRPANLALPAADPNWFRFRVSDRRGNLTDSWLIPIPPGSEKTKANLPALEPVQF